MPKKQSIEMFLEDNPPENYTIEALRSGVLSPEEIRAHYSYLRKIANKRLSKFPGSEFETAQSYLKNVGKFVPLSEINNERELLFKLSDLSNFVRLESSTVSGNRRIRNRIIETAHENGLTWLNKGNIKDFGEYMDNLRTKYRSKQFDSEGAQMLFGMITQGVVQIDTEDVQKDFAFWSKHVRDLAQLPKEFNSEPRNADDYKRELSKKKKR